ncbi:MAG: nucleotidyltransferase family protein [Ignavibacteriales bacterium]
MKKEHTAVLEIVKMDNNKDKLIEILDDKSINWIEVLGYLCYHRVAGLAYERINSINIRKLDFPVFFSIYMIHQSQSLRLDLQKEYIKDISSKLCECNIKHVFLKGSVLSSTLYPAGTRASNDIDILVSKDSIQEVKKALYELDFVQGKYNYKNDTVEEFDNHTIAQSIKDRGETAPFIKVINKVTIKTIDVDVNFSLDWNPNANNEIVTSFLDERILVPIDSNSSIYSLKEEHLFIQLCIHLYKDSVLLDIVKKRKVLDLYKFVDLYLFIQKYFETINPEKIFEDSIKYNFDKQVFFALNYTAKIFPDIMKIDNVNILYQKYNYIGEKIMTEIFDQYNSENKMEDTGNLIDRLFSYDIINKYN